MGLVVDLSAGTGSAGFEPIPKGAYHACITDVELAEAGENAKNPGSHYLKYEFTIQNGEFENRKLWTNASLLPQALFTIKGIIGALGGDPMGSIDVDDVLESHIGKELILIVQVKKKNAQYANFEGEMENNIKQFKPLTGKGAVPLSGGIKPKDPLLP